MSIDRPPGYGDGHRPQGRDGTGPIPYSRIVPAPGMAPLATTGQRFLARVVDTFVLFLMWMGATAATGALQYAAENPGEQAPGKVLAALVLTFCAYFAYEGAMLARSGQTLGKKAARIRVALLADGDVPGGRGWVRAAVYALPGLLVPIVIGWVFWIVDSLSFLMDSPYRPCLHDRAAGTVVVQAG